MFYRIEGTAFESAENIKLGLGLNPQV